MCVSGPVICHSSITQFSSQDSFLSTRNKGQSVSMVSHILEIWVEFYIVKANDRLHQPPLNKYCAEAQWYKDTVTECERFHYYLRHFFISGTMWSRCITRWQVLLKQGSHAKKHEVAPCPGGQDRKTHQTSFGKHALLSLGYWSSQCWTWVFFYRHSTGKLLPCPSHDTLTERKVSTNCCTAAEDYDFRREVRLKDKREEICSNITITLNTHISKHYYRGWVKKQHKHTRHERSSRKVICV